MTRNSLLTLAAVAALVAVSTTAEARGGSGGSSSGHSGGNAVSFNRSSGNSIKVSTPIAIQQKTTVTRFRDDDSHHKRPYKYRWIEPSPVVVVPTPVVVEPIRSTGAGGAATSVRVIAPGKTPVVAKATESTTETAAPGATGTCLTKEYLDTGAVMFRDTCTEEWAINATDVTKKVTPAAPTCLTKDTDQNGVVMFRDTCTKEWAMNAPDQMAQAPQAR